MLKKIHCNKFKPEANTIILHKGLNVVIGDGEKSNSIGKSTFLMLIDFCFGGRDYTKVESETIAAIGHHTIDFVFEFDNKEYYFSRSTSDYLTVLEYQDEQHTLLKTRHHLDNFNEFLAEKYKIAILELTLRSVIGKFFRIYNRHTINEVRPLNSSLNDDDKQAIINFLKLYNCPIDINSLLDKQNEIKAKKSSLEGLNKYNLGFLTTNQNEYERNKTRIEEIKKELLDYEMENNLGVIDVKSVVYKEKRRLKQIYSNLKRQETKLLNSLNEINVGMLNETYSLQTIEKLKEFFPDVKIDEFKKIEEFHTKVKRILNSQAKEENKSIQAQIDSLRIELKNVGAKLGNYDYIPNIKQEIVDKNVNLRQELDNLQRANKNYEEYSLITEELSTIKEQISNATTQDIHAVSTKINGKMAELQRKYGDSTKYPPQIQISNLSTYKFGVPKDTGTANRYKSVVTFDVSVLLQTVLPVIVHDSVFFDAQGDVNIHYMLSLYSLVNDKQIFIAYDDKNSLSKEDRNYLESNIVLRLSKGSGALFGKEFNTKKE